MTITINILSGDIHMNKKLLAMAVSAAMFAPVAAQADVSVYGRVQVEYSVEDSDGVSGSIQAVDDNAGQSRLGFKFSEKLGDGLTAFGKLEFRLDAADNSSNGTNGNSTAVSGALGQRDAHVGLKSSWGSLAAGSFHSPYKTAGGVKWDPMIATHLQARRAGGMTGGAGFGGHNGFVRNAIQYKSPNVNGFHAEFMIAPDETNSSAGNGDGGTGAGPGDDNDYGLSVQYKNGPWHAIFAHTRDNNTTEDQKLTKVGLQWKGGAWTLAGQYEDVNDVSASGHTVNAGTTPGPIGGESYRPGAGDDANVLWLNAQFKAGNNIFTASYGNTDVDDAGGADFEYDYWMVGIIHKFSKKTRIFGGYTQTDGDSNGNTDDRDAWTVGIRQDF
jgi:predicted porin